MKITPVQQYILFGVFVFGVVSALFFQFVIKPINIDIVTKTGIRDQKKKDLEEAKKIVAKYAEFKKRADSIQRELEWIQNRIPRSIERTKLLEAVSLVQKRSGVYITSLQFQGSGVGAGEVPVSIRFTSTYEGLINFLYQVSVSNLVMTTRDLVVAPFSDSTRPNTTLAVNLVVSGVQAK